MAKNEHGDETIVTPKNDNEQLDELEVEEEESEEEETESGDESDNGESNDDDESSHDEDEKVNKDSKKNHETPEAKLARLKRQLERQQKKMGLNSDEKKPESKKKETEPSISSIDVYSLIKANVPEEDFSEVVEYAKFKKISIKDALKSSTVKTLLKEKSEERTTAEATNVSTARRGNTRPSADSYLENARKTGSIPESDADIKSMIRARKGLKK